MPKITVIGDIMLDEFFYGSVKRINPESPWTPLIRIEKEEFKLWGAGNVAANISSLWGDVELIGNVGNDHNWQKLQELCEEYNIELINIINDYPTITKQRFIVGENNHQLLRADFEEKIQLQKSHKRKIIKHIKKNKSEFLILSDYHKGIFSEDLVRGIKRDVSNILVDAKPEQISFFNDVYLIKPNFKEFCEMLGKKPDEEIKNTDEEMAKYGLQFVKKYNTNLVVTRGSKWASLITKKEEIYHLPTEAKEVFDVTWAGDTFLATLTVALQKGYNLSEAVQRANKASGVVVQEAGTATIKPDKLGW